MLKYTTLAFQIVLMETLFALLNVLESTKLTYWSVHVSQVVQKAVRVRNITVRRPLYRLQQRQLLQQLRPQL